MVLDPDKDKLVNDWLTQTMTQRPGGNPSVPAPSLDAPINAKPDDTPESNDANNEKVVDSHPGNQASDLDQYIKGQESQLDKFGPEQEQAVMGSVLKSQYGLPMGIAKAGAGFADALMQGVSRAGPGQFAQNLQNDNQNMTKSVGDLQNHLQEGNIKQVGLKQGLESQRPGSAISQSATPVLEATLKAMGIPDNQLPKFLSNPAEARKAIDVLKEVIPAKDKVKIENELRIMELKFQEQNASANRGVAEEGKQNEAKRTQQEADKALIAGSSGLSALNPMNPISHQMKTDAVNRLAGMGSSQMSPEDQKAIAWAKQNPRNPKSDKILKLHGL